MIKQIYENIVLQLRDTILSEIAAAFANRPPTIPCKVIEKTGSTVSVIPTINIGVTLKTMTNIPIAKSKYIDQPLSPGDKGMLVPSNYIFNGLILDPPNLEEISDPKPSTNFSGYMFIPLSAKASDYLAGGKHSVVYSQDGTTWIAIKNGKLHMRNDTTDIKTLLSDLVTDVNAALDSISVNGSSGPDPQGGIVTINSTSVSHTSVPDDFGLLLD